MGPQWDVLKNLNQICLFRKLIDTWSCHYVYRDTVSVVTSVTVMLCNIISGQVQVQVVTSDQCDHTWWQHSQHPDISTKTNVFLIDLQTDNTVIKWSSTKDISQRDGELKMTFYLNRFLYISNLKSVTFIRVYHWEIKLYWLMKIWCCIHICSYQLNWSDIFIEACDNSVKTYDASNPVSDRYQVFHVSSKNCVSNCEMLAAAVLSEHAEYELRDSARHC